MPISFFYRSTQFLHFSTYFLPVIRAFNYNFNSNFSYSKLLYETGPCVCGYI
jgi:hypothetical protein